MSSQIFLNELKRGVALNVLLGEIVEELLQRLECWETFECGSEVR